MARRIAVTGLVFNKSSLPLFGFARAASRASPVWAANKQRQSTRTARLLWALCVKERSMRALAVTFFLTLSLSSFAGTELETSVISPMCEIELAKFEEENKEHARDFISRVARDNIMKMLSVRRVAISDGALNVQQVVDLRISEMMLSMLNKESLSLIERDYMKSLKDHLTTYPLEIPEERSVEIREKLLAMGI